MLILAWLGWLSRIRQPTWGQLVVWVGGCWTEGGTDDVCIGGRVALVRECGLNKEVLVVVRLAWVVLMLLEGVWHVLVDGQVVGSVALVNQSINIFQFT